MTGQAHRLQEFYKTCKPNDADIADAKRWFQRLQERQEQIRRTREARADRPKRALLEQELEFLGIDDSAGRLATALAFYSRDAIVNGLAIFRAKQQLGTLPPGADPGRYLGGIIRNVDEEAELQLLSEYFVRNRERLRDFSLQALMRESARIQHLPHEQQVQTTLQRALQAGIAIDYNFWAAKCAEALAALSAESRMEAYRTAARQISVSYQCKRERKQTLLARIATAVIA